MFDTPPPRPRYAASRRVLVLKATLPYREPSGYCRSPLIFNGERYRMVIAPGAFARFLGKPIRVQVDHLAGLRADAVLTDSAGGVRVEIELDPNRPDHARCCTEARAGRLTGVSFGSVGSRYDLALLESGDNAEVIREIRNLEEITVCRAPTRPAFSSAVLSCFERSTGP